MLIADFFKWWYTKGWLDFGKKIIARLRYLTQFFSFSILIRTLFAPWRRIVTIPGKSIGEKLRAFLDNLISRIIGFLTRTLVLVAALILITLIAVVGLILFISWPFAPILVIFLIFKSFL